MKRMTTHGKSRKFVALSGVVAALFAAYSSGYSGSEGKLNFCVYKDRKPEQPENYIVKQGGGSRCFYGMDDYERLDYPLQPKGDLAHITVTRAGINCADSDLKRHFMINNSFFGGCNPNGLSMSTISIQKVAPEKDQSIEFNFGDEINATHRVAVYRGNSHKRFSLETLQLSTSKHALSGTNMLDCPGGWCTRGEAPLSTMYVIWSPKSDMAPYKATNRKVNTSDKLNNYEYLTGQKARQDCENSAPDKACNKPAETGNT